MKTVPLYGKKAAGRVALVDDEDYDLVMQYRWSAWAYGRSVDVVFYAITSTACDGSGKRTTLRMHKLITGWPRTDHENHNGLDNRRSNLRPASASQNGANRRPNLGASSRFKGVSWRPVQRKWTARITDHGRLRHLGYFRCEEDAAKAYDQAAHEVFGEYACLNFPDAV